MLNLLEAYTISMHILRNFKYIFEDILNDFVVNLIHFVELEGVNKVCFTLEPMIRTVLNRLRTVQSLIALLVHFSSMASFHSFFIQM